MKDEPPPASLLALRGTLRRLIHELLSASNRLRLPGPSVLPVAGAVVGLYSGLAAGIFANLIGVVNALTFNLASASKGPRQPGSSTLVTLWEALSRAHWHPEYSIIGAPLALGALVLARVIEPGGPRDEVKRRLRVLALLVLGALALYYPLVALTALNRAFGPGEHLAQLLPHLPWWIYLLAPSLGGMLVGRLLRDYPDTHGHGVPEVVRAVKSNQELPGQRGLLKLVGSAITIGSGGSGGREGPIVYGGAAFASTVGRTLILPLMVTCTIASALCHYLTERKAPKVPTDEELLATTPVRVLMRELAPVPADMHLRPLMDQVLATESGTLPVLDGDGRLYGIVQVDQFRDIWRDETLLPMLVASDLARKVPLLTPDMDLTHALHLMDQENVDALPVEGPPGSQTCGLLTRATVRRFLSAHHLHQHALGEHLVAPTEASK